MVIDVNVDIAIVIRIASALLPDNQDRRGLPAAAVTAGFVTCLQRGVEFLGKLIVRALEGFAHRFDNMRSDQNVALRRPGGSLQVTFPILGAITGKGCD